ncbi:MAG: hypothetical protein LBS88_13665 [Tannerellaceae bacterium]|nr:hypothetical protein [Tannerellaceae bacterium]
MLCFFSIYLIIRYPHYLIQTFVLPSQHRKPFFSEQNSQLDIASGAHHKVRFEAQQVHNLCCREPLAVCLILLILTEIRMEQVFFRRTDAEGFVVLCNLLDFNLI